MPLLRQYFALCLSDFSPDVGIFLISILKFLFSSASRVDLLSLDETRWRVKAGAAAVFAVYVAAAFRATAFGNSVEFAEMTGLRSGIGAAADFTHTYSAGKRRH
jgi:hypothetical protein